jgi:hypothetical protein
MITRNPSYQREYKDHWSGDPALEQAPTDAALLEEYERKLRVARETGDWQPLCLAGQQPTTFVMGQVDRNIWRALHDRMSLPASNPRRIGPAEGVALLLRLALLKIVGFDVEVERRPDPRWHDWVMASPEVVNALDAIDEGIVEELGDQVYARLRGLSKK